MFDLRSRAALAGATSGAAVLLAVPVVAFGQVPGVDQVVGGVNQAAQDVVQAAPAPPVRLPAPPPAPAPAPKPKPAAPAPAPAAAAPAPAAPAPAPAASAPARSAPASASQGSSGSGGSTHARAAGGKRSKASGDRSGVRVHAAADKKASEPKANAAQTDTDIADDPASMPKDASPQSLPFTGLQLALMVLAGLAALATGSVVRRAARTRS